jgi:uncharacterized protein (TIGR02246 family)
MKNVLSTLVLLAFCFQLNAQTSGVLWVGSRSSNANANAVHTAITTAYDAFLKGDESGWAIYTDDVAEINPAGVITFGKKAMLEGFNEFMKMADEAPKFSYSNVLVRMLTNDVALAVWDSEADIKIGGQQVGGKTKDMAVLRKINGAWKIEFDSMTPEIGMPALDAAGKN